MLTIEEIIKATKGELIQGNLNDTVSNFQIDSRPVTEESFYCPILGEKVDGQKFIMDCVRKHCKGFFVSDMNYVDVDNVDKDTAIIKVANTKQALIDIGVYNREKHREMEVVAITGSVGKTSTREMVNSVLKEHFNTLSTMKNMNSHIGMPLITLMMDKQELAILEAGVDFDGEMDILNKLLIPSVAVVTNIGTSHIGKFGSQDNIYKEKIKIANNLVDKKTLLLNKDDPYLAKYENPNIHIIYYGYGDAENVKYNPTSIEFDTNIYNKKEHVVINAIGNHNVINSIIAIRIAELYNLTTKEIINGISKYTNYEKRMNAYEASGMHLIDDTYNASPSSTESGLRTVEMIAPGRKIAVLADILELGDYSKKIHTDLGEVFKELSYDVVIAFGNDIKYLVESASKYVPIIYMYNNSKEAEEKLRDIMQPNDTIYFKGSRSMNVSEIVDNIRRDFE